MIAAGNAAKNIRVSSVTALSVLFVILVEFVLFMEEALLFPVIVPVLVSFFTFAPLTFFLVFRLTPSALFFLATTA